MNISKSGAGEGTGKVRRTDRVRNEVLQRVKGEKNTLLAIKRRKTNWIGHMLRRNFLLKHVIEGSDGKTRTKTEATTV